jgi:hypothetical protein
MTDFHTSITSFDEAFEKSWSFLEYLGDSSNLYDMKKSDALGPAKAPILKKTRKLQIKAMLPIKSIIAKLQPSVSPKSVTFIDATKPPSPSSKDKYFVNFTQKDRPTCFEESASTLLTEVETVDTESQCDDPEMTLTSLDSPTVDTQTQFEGSTGTPPTRRRQAPLDKEHRENTKSPIIDGPSVETTTPLITRPFVSTRTRSYRSAFGTRRKQAPFDKEHRQKQLSSITERLVWDTIGYDADIIEMRVSDSMTTV